MAERVTLCNPQTGAELSVFPVDAREMLSRGWQYSATVEAEKSPTPDPNAGLGPDPHADLDQVESGTPLAELKGEQLLALAKEQGIAVPPGAKKSDILQLLSAR